MRFIGSDDSSDAPEKVSVRIRDCHGRETLVTGDVLSSGNVMVSAGAITAARRKLNCNRPRCDCVDTWEVIGGEWLPSSLPIRRIRPLFMWGVDGRIGHGFSLAECQVKARAYVKANPSARFLHVLETERRPTVTGEIPPARMVYEFDFATGTPKLYPGRETEPPPAESARETESGTLHVQHDPNPGIGPDDFGGEDFPSVPFQFDDD